MGEAGPEFIEKFLHDFGSTFHEGIILVNSRATDADWFQPLFEGIICFTDHRIDFNSPHEKATSSTHGSCFVYLGKNQKKFAEVFSQFGANEPPNIIERAQKIIASMENTCSGRPCDIVRELVVRIAGLEIKYADKQIQCDTQRGERKDLSGTESQILSESN